MTVGKVVGLAAYTVVVFMIGALMTEATLRQGSNAIAQDKNALLVILAECNYFPHPISDVSWELYRQGLIPLGTAGYYTGALRSVNGPAAKCLREVLPEQWVAPGGS